MCPRTRRNALKTIGSELRNLKYLLSVQKSRDTDLEHPSYFPKVKGFLTVIRIGRGA